MCEMVLPGRVVPQMVPHWVHILACTGWDAAEPASNEPTSGEAAALTCKMFTVMQDPSNKQFVLCDETLKHLTGEARLKAFGFQSLVKQHFLKD